MSEMTITIIGCGWLGRPLGEQLHTSGHTVYGSTRNESFFDELNAIGIQPFLLDSYQKVTIPKKVIDKTDLLIITLPPTSRNKGVLGIEENREFMEKLAAQFEDSTRVIFTSSTGIYPKREREYYETYTFTDKEQQTSTYQLEEAIKHSKKSSVILRLGGLIGPNRHPITSLAGREYISNPDGPINIVHLNDVINAIEKVTNDTSISGVFNLVNPMHPSRESYYRSAAKHYDLTAPKFAQSTSIHRLISGQKLMQEHDFKYNSPLFIFPKLDKY